jgi:hypothetical protein
MKNLSACLLLGLSLSVVAACSGAANSGVLSDVDAGVTVDVDGGTLMGMDGSVDPKNDPAFSGASICTSGKKGPTGAGLSMNPGTACNACHKTQAANRVFAWGGTVYATGHEPDQCVGVPSTAGAVVVITGANGKEVKMPVNGGGNFGIYARDAKAMALTAPFSARVEQGGKVRAMSTPLKATDGDCNGCHTEAGSQGAPGRIALP